MAMGFFGGAGGQMAASIMAQPPKQNNMMELALKYAPDIMVALSKQKLDKASAANQLAQQNHYQAQADALTAQGQAQGQVSNGIRSGMSPEEVLPILSRSGLTGEQQKQILDQMNLSQTQHAIGGQLQQAPQRDGSMLTPEQAMQQVYSTGTKDLTSEQVFNAKSLHQKLVDDGTLEHNHDAVLKYTDRLTALTGPHALAAAMADGKTSREQAYINAQHIAMDELAKEAPDAAKVLSVHLATGSPEKAQKFLEDVYKANDEHVKTQSEVRKNDATSSYLNKGGDLRTIQTRAVDETIPTLQPKATAETARAAAEAKLAEYKATHPDVSGSEKMQNDNWKEMLKTNSTELNNLSKIPDRLLSPDQRKRKADVMANIKDAQTHLGVSPAAAKAAPTSNHDVMLDALNGLKTSRPKKGY